MSRRLLVAFLIVLVLFEMTTSFPLSNYQNELESGVDSSKSQDQITFETVLKGNPDISSSFVRVQRSLKQAPDHDGHGHKHHGHGTSHLPISSRDQGETPNSKTNWFAANRKSPKFIAISIFLGCLAFMSLAFAIACCVHYREQGKRVKEATQVDVRSREDLSDQVSKIENVHVDVGGY